MKLLFLQNLEHHKVGDIKEIPDGYARNYLLPKGIAVPATDEKVAELEKKMAKIEKEEEKVTADLTALAEKIEAKTFTVEAQAGEEDKLFGAVTNRDLAEVLAKNKIEIDKHDIEILEPIHSLGEHEALVKLGHGVHATMKIKVERAK
jgi:large subunit ribosomal protein L9